MIKPDAGMDGELGLIPPCPGAKTCTGDSVGHLEMRE